MKCGGENRRWLIKASRSHPSESASVLPSNRPFTQKSPANSNIDPKLHRTLFVPSPTRQQVRSLSTARFSSSRFPSSALGLVVVARHLTHEWPHLKWSRAIFLGKDFSPPRFHSLRLQPAVWFHSCLPERLGIGIFNSAITFFKSSHTWARVSAV